MRKSQQNFNKEQHKLDDDLLSEISTPEINYDERSKIMDLLNKREKDRQELELEMCFDKLLGKAEGVEEQEIEKVANQSAKEFRESGKLNIYKPQLKGMTPRKGADLAIPKPVALSKPPTTKVQTWVERPKSSAAQKQAADGMSRLDAIYAQLREL